jgi:cell wall-associated NlpC family hydrolase
MGDARNHCDRTNKTAHYPAAARATPARRGALILLLGILTACTSGPPLRHAGIKRPDPVRDTTVMRANEVTLRALGLVGTPYRYGGNTPDGGFDCSGLVGFVYRDAGATALPRTTAELAAMPARPVARGALRTGDLVFFGEGAAPSHVGIYVGEGRFVHAPNEGGTVRLDALDNAYWNRHFRFARRIAN